LERFIDPPEGSAATSSLTIGPFSPSTSPEEMEKWVRGPQRKGETLSTWLLGNASTSVRIFRVAPFSQNTMAREIRKARESETGGFAAIFFSGSGRAGKKDFPMEYGA